MPADRPLNHAPPRVMEAAVLPAPHARGAGDVLLLTTRLDLDLATEDDADREVRAALLPGPGVAGALLDVSAVFVGVAGIRVMLAGAERARAAGYSFVVVGAPAWLIELAPAIGAGSLTFCPTVEHGLAHTGGTRVEIDLRPDGAAASPLATQDLGPH